MDFYEFFLLYILSVSFTVFGTAYYIAKSNNSLFLILLICFFWSIIFYFIFI